MFSITLENAYFQILIHLDSQPYFQIALNGKGFQFQHLNSFPGPHKGVLHSVGVDSQERNSFVCIAVWMICKS